MAHQPPPAETAAAPASFFLVRALHSFSPSSLPPSSSSTSTSTAAQTCLAFKQGQLLRCFNRDPSGWWDGQVVEEMGQGGIREGEEGQEGEGKRGWFPSNYVEVLPPIAQAGQEQDQRVPPPTTATSTLSDAPSTTSTAAAASTPNPNPAATPSPSQEQEAHALLLDRIDHHAALLEAAVRERRKEAYQPTTACVISSIRTVLSSTSCLTRDSPLLKQYPPVSSARKRILTSLARLVNAARRASAPTLGTEGAGSRSPSPSPNAEGAANARRSQHEEEQQQREEAEANADLVGISRETVRLVRVFLDRARENGIQVELEKAYHQTGLVGASTGDEKGTPLLGGGGGGGDSSAASPLPSATTRTRTTATKKEEEEEEVRLSSAEAVSTHLSTLHEALRSVLLALTTHLQQEPSSSASTTTTTITSFPRVIDLTRLAIERVRDLLSVVERVGEAALARSSSDGAPKMELERLKAEREGLYLATTGLVNAAREATLQWHQQQQPATTTPSSPNFERASTVRLQEATRAVLRSAGECVSAAEGVVQFLFQQDRTLDFFVPRSRTAAEQLDEPAGVVQSSEMMTEGSVDTLRKHAEEEGSDLPEAVREKRRSSALLNSLGRKAASLGVLRERFEGDKGGATGVATSVERLTIGTEPASDVPLSSSPVETLAPAIPAVPPNNNSSTATTKRDSATSMMMRQQSTESAHSQTSSHVTNLSLASSAALTTHTAETSPRTSLSATAANNGVPKRISASSLSMSRPSSRNEVLTSLAIPARLSSNGSLRDMPMASPSLPFNYVLPAPSTSSLLSPTSANGPSPFSNFSANGTPTATKHTSGAASSTTSGGLWYLERDYEPREISFNADGHVSGGTLRCLVERMTLHDTTIDAGFSNTFLLTFRMFTTPLDLARLLWARFDLSPPTHPDTGAALSPEELKKWTSQKLTPIRLRVYNLFKTWLEIYWLHDQDREVVDDLLEWTEGRLREALPAPSKRLAELVSKRIAGATGTVKRSSIPNEFGLRTGANGSATPSESAGSTGGRARGFLSRMQSTGQLRQGSISAASFSSTATFSKGGPGDVYSPSPDSAANAPTPAISKSLIAALRPTLNGRSHLLSSVVELDPLELARQLTIMESRIYCSIRPEELLAAATSGSDTASKSSLQNGDGGSAKAHSVRQMSAMSTRLTGWIAETILNEHDQKRRTGLVKFFIKLGEHLLALGNYNALFAVFTALSSSTIARLQKTWDGLAPKHKATFGTLRKATDHTRNYAEYRQKVRQALPPCLPFVGLFLTDLIFVYEGNRSERASPADPELSLINFDRYHKMARVVGELQRFQSPYALIEVPEMQSYLTYELDALKSGADAQSLYRQSLMIEPRQGDAPSSSAASIVSSHSGHRAGRDLLGWRA
ncbi:hypothetical protein JCM10908_004513 [Rhodotorula pacifica]|uniref:uncharacterized protein n=1 Tax=Rhodotorula pacifica TaxID=1495444 RepID=UPI0031726620